MSQSAHIGSSIVIKGELTASEPVVIAGRVEGSIDVTGHEVTVAQGGELHGDATTDALVIAGTFRGDVVANRRVEVRSSADVEGSITAPAVTIADGAVVRGKVQTTSKIDLAKAS
ncbi:MAG TPA: polymer-forming cytoskeletal protein [Vicinamibacterales bacterium]|nr:polymer-forming cytoskeletal protein [Vicinamibacterales bacterium]